MQIFTEVFQIPVFGAVYARLRGHSIACTLIPLAVLKHKSVEFYAIFIGDCMHPNTA
ncbi:hypothetical protein SAMN02745190_01720, partial [Schwartzia succinivorans DSM 10502]